MAEVNLTQVEAEKLIAMEKHCIDDDSHDFLLPGQKLSVDLLSIDKREKFIFNINRGKINLLKVTYQNRARQVIPLIRLDVSGPTHRNPDGTEVSCPHLHIYREGYGDKWAYPAPSDTFTDMKNLRLTLDEFMKHCNITKVPNIIGGLF